MLVGRQPLDRRRRLCIGCEGMDRAKPTPILPIILIVAVPVLALVGALCWVNLNLSSMPDPFPVHWGIGGEPNGWVPRTRVNVSIFFADMILICAVLGGIGAATKLGIRRISVGAKSSRVERMFYAGTLLLLIAFEYLAAGIALLPVGFPAAPTVIGSLMLGIVGTGGLIIMGRDGSHMLKNDTLTPSSDLRIDKNWKWGIFYLNPDDPALIVKKRYGIGYTFNFGHAESWIGLAGICIMLLVTVWLTRQVSQINATSAIGGQLSDQLLSALKDNDFEGAERNFSSVMKQKLPSRALARVWAKTTGTLGDLETWKPTNSERHGGFEARNYDARFTSGRLRVLVAIDPVDAQVVGLWFLDPVAE